MLTANESRSLGQGTAVSGLIDVNDIKVPADRCRALRPHDIAGIAASFQVVGQLQPIVVRPLVDGGYSVIAGVHRLKAAEKLGWKTISATVRDGLSTDLIELAEIDENLIRAELTPAERALHVGRRKQIYERLHPEAKHGGDRKSAGSSRQIGDLKRFTADAAEKTGQSERALQRDAERADKVVVLPDIAGTSLDKGVEIDALAKLPAAEQRTIAEAAKRGEKVTARTGLKPVQIVEARLVGLEIAITLAWGPASVKARGAFLDAHVDEFFEALQFAPKLKTKLTDRQAQHFKLKQIEPEPAPKFLSKALQHPAITASETAEVRKAEYAAKTTHL